MMKFPNAAKGVKKIFSAEMLSLFGSVALVIAAILIGIGMGSGLQQTDTGYAVAGGTMLGGVILIVVWAVLSVIAFILNLVGIINATHDETNFKSALFFLVAGIASSILSAAFSSNGVLCSVFHTIGTLMQVFVTLFVIAGCVKLADKLNRGDISAKGTNILKIVLVIYALSLIASIISAILGGLAGSITAAVLFITAIVLEIIVYFMYLSFLSKTKKMLAEA